MARHATATADAPAALDLAAPAILSPQQTYQLTNLSSATIWRLRRQGEFPHPVRLSPGRMGWRRRDVEQWVAERQDIAHYLRPSPNPRARPAKVERVRAPRRRRPVVEADGD
jgi:prophage regulatory protein